ncbi:centrosomal protein of 290 kDa-like [Zophobas morio]|uniref:centrosomal protein of 290 kDa-like n=1 Tax=Zophobas morio TaxID=2755281 RepID=UPI0030826E58
MSSKGTERKKRDREVESPKENEQVFQRSKITVRAPLQSREKENQEDIEMEEVKKMISELATQIRDDIRDSNKQLLNEWNTQLKEELKTIREELKQTRDQLQGQNQEIRDKYKEWKRAKEEMGKRVGEVESQLDRMEREKRRNKVVMMGLDIATGEQKQIIGKVTKFLEKKVKVERLRKKEKEFWDYVGKFDVVGLVETWVQRENWEKLEETLPQEYGQKSDVKNYRGITLLNTAYKIYAMILDERLRKEMEARGMLPDGQAGFRKGRAHLEDIDEMFRKAQTGGVVVGKEKVWSLAYADDLVIVAKKREVMRARIKSLEMYVKKKKKLEVNVEKTKMVVFGKKLRSQIKRNI